MLQYSPQIPKFSPFPPTSRPQIASHRNLHPLHVSRPHLLPPFAAAFLPKSPLSSVPLAEPLVLPPFICPCRFTTDLRDSQKKLHQPPFYHSASTSYLSTPYSSLERLKEGERAVNSHLSCLKQPEWRGRPTRTPSNLLHLLHVPSPASSPIRPHRDLQLCPCFLVMIAWPPNPLKFPPMSPPPVPPRNLT